MRKSPILLGIVELPRALDVGDKIEIAGEKVEIFEIKRLKNVSRPIAGRNRQLYAVLHAGEGSIVVAVCLDGDQREWSVF